MRMSRGLVSLFLLMLPLLALAQGPSWPTPCLVQGVIQVESKGNPLAQNGISTGLMQVNGATPREREKLRNPEYNLQRGIALLREYKAQLGSEDAAIMAYNIGIGNYLRNYLRGVGRKYLEKVRHAEEVCSRRGQ